MFVQLLNQHHLNEKCGMLQSRMKGFTQQTVENTMISAIAVQLVSTFVFICKEDTGPF